MHPPEERDSRERLLREAERLFMAHGFAAVSTREICTAAGVKQPSLYHHFGSKEGLYLAVVQRWFDAHGAGVQRAIAAHSTLREQLHGVALVLWSETAGGYQAMQRDALMNLAPDHVQKIGQMVWQALLHPLVTLFAAARERGDLPAHADPLVLTQIFWGLVDGINGIYRRGDPMPAPEANVGIIDFFLAGARGMSAEDFAIWPRQWNPQLFTKHTE